MASVKTLEQCLVDAEQRKLYTLSNLHVITHCLICIITKEEALELFAPDAQPDTVACDGSVCACESDHVSACPFAFLGAHHDNDVPNSLFYIGRFLLSFKRSREAAGKDPRSHQGGEDRGHQQAVAEPRGDAAAARPPAAVRYLRRGAQRACASGTLGGSGSGGAMRVHARFLSLETYPWAGCSSAA